jgi:Lysylphosphatidylglycerol synthase TM region
VRRPPLTLQKLPLRVTTSIAAVAFLVSLAVMATIAGWSKIDSHLHAPLSFWFAVALAAELLAFGAYVLCYRSVASVSGGRRLGVSEAVELVAVGFGAFLAKGGAALDSAALRPKGQSKREGEVRVMALDALEHAPLAPAACIASIVLLVHGKRTPGLDFTVPWAVLTPLGAILAGIGVRHRKRFIGRPGWRGKLGDALDAIDDLFRLARNPGEHWPAFVGATVYWGGDVLCLWASLKPFDAAPGLAPIVLAHAVGYSLTRRTLPFAGAGIVEVLMPLTLVACGAPFAGAILGVLTYRVFNLWLPLLPAAVAVPRLRRRYGRAFQPA